MSKAPVGMAWAIALGSLATAQDPGLRLFQPMGQQETQIVDNQGVIVHSWPGTGNLSAHVEADGTMVRSLQVSTLGVPGATGMLQRLSFDGTVLWEYVIDGPFEYAHHDIEPMPNGNVLVIAWDRYATIDAVASGRDPALLMGTNWLPDAVLEIQPTGPTTGSVVWEWHMMDHIIQDFDPTRANYGDVAAHPELLDINYPPEMAFGGDWNHFNGIDYDPIHDWIIVSARMQNEVYIIDHSTTTAEASGHTGGTHGKGGDFLWRWGDPQAYRAGTVADRQLHHQHDPRFIPPGYPGAGHVTVFNNEYVAGQSAVVELELPLDPSGSLVLDPTTGRFGPATPFWLYTDPSFLSLFVSSAERLPNGNTLVCSGAQISLFEVDAAGQLVWAYTYPTNAFIFQANYVDRSLWRDAATLPVGGAQVGFDRLLGSEFGGKFYLMLGSVSGTSPGLPLGGGVTLPLNADYLTDAMATHFNSGVFVDTIGTLDAHGGAPSTLAVGPGVIPTPLVGIEMNFADLIFDNLLLALRTTNAVKVTITP